MIITQTRLLDPGVGFLRLTPADIDGAGNEKIVRVNYRMISNRASLEYSIYDTNGAIIKSRTSSFLRANDNQGTFTHGSYRNLVPINTVFGDFDGDGKVEMLAISSSKLPNNETRSSLAVIVKLQDDTNIFNGSSFNYDATNDILIPLDYDGDGKTDLCVISKSGIGIYTLTDGQLKYRGRDGSFTSKDFGPGNRKLLLGDINADGKTDFMVSSEMNFPVLSDHDGECKRCCNNEINLVTNTGQMKIYKCPGGNTDVCRVLLTPEYKYAPGAFEWTYLFSTGSGSEYQTLFKKENKTLKFSNEFKCDIALQDVNGDGVPDIVFKNHDKVLETYLNVNGTISLNKENTQSTVSIEDQSTFMSLNWGNSWGNFGKINDLVSVTKRSLTPIEFTRDDALQNMLTGVINSSGVITQHKYQRINKLPVTTTQYTYPYAKMNMDINVLTGIRMYLNNSVLSNVSFSYYDAVINKHGLGFRGFGKIEKTDHIRNMTSTNTYDPSNFGVIRSENSPLISTTYNYSFNVAANKIAKITLTGKSETDKLNDNTTLYSYTYDSYGTMLSEIVDYGGGHKSTTNNKVNNFTTTPYLLGEIYEQTIKKDVGTESVTFKTTYTYNTNHQATSKKDYVNNILFAEQAYVYDAGYNLIESKTKGYNSSRWTSVKYTYDTHGRVLRETKPTGLFIDRIYNSRGEVSSTKDHKGLATNYTYDAFGRAAKTTYPDGTSYALSLAWSDEGSYYVLETGVGQPNTKTYYDGLNREIRNSEIRFDGKELKVDTKYDSKGRVEKISLAYSGNSPGLWNTIAYDNYDRIISSTAASGNTVRYSYTKNSMTTLKDGISTTKTANQIGQLVKITDPSGIITHKYRPDGQLSSTNAIGQVTTFEYDVYGRKTAIVDPSSGRVTTLYDADGNVIRNTDARGKAVNMSYDAYGRMIQSITDGVTSNITYNSDGLVTNITNSDGTSKSFTYHATYYDRIEKEKEIIQDNKWLEKSFTYSNGNIASISYMSSESSNTNFAVENYIYANGHVKEIKVGSVSVWRLDAETAFGAPSQVTTGALTRTYGYTEFGLPASRITKKGTAVVQDFSYGIDKNTGNLTWRKDNTRNLQENFGYDDLNRLTSFSGKTVKYDNYGNITEISTIGAFAYNANKPYAVASVTPFPNSPIPMRYQEISYNSMMRASSISENNIVTDFSYNQNGDRTKMVRKKDNKEELTRYYLDEGAYEIDKGIAGAKEKLYIGGDVYTAAAVYIKEGGKWSINYICRDYLGSITHITDASGNLKQELSYDAWGRLRHPMSYVAYESNNQPFLLLDRGYTGHEHLTAYGLINMNARLYDPILGRFLSPDPYVQNPFLPQNYNRYSYVLNNPLRYTDPSGEFIHIIVGAVVGGVINWVANGCQFNAKGLGYFGVGAAAGALSAGVGSGVSSLLGGGSFSAGFLGTSAAKVAGTSFINGMAIGSSTGLSGGLVSGTGNGLVEGQSFGKSLSNGLIYGGVGAISGGVIGGTVQGIQAAIDGRNFWDGSRLISETTIADKRLPLVKQKGNMNCGPATAESITGISQEDYRNAIGGSANVNPVTDVDLNKAITSKTGRSINRFSTSLPKDATGARQLAGMMNSGNDFYLASQGAGQTIGHAAALNSVTIKEFVSLKGQTFYKVVYYAMDPARASKYVTIGSSPMKMVYRIHP